MTDATTGSGLTDAEHDALLEAFELAFQHVPLGLYDEHRKPAERALGELLGSLDRLRADQERLREAGNALEEGARIIEVMLHEPAFKGLTTADDFATYLAGAWLGLAERMAAWRSLVAGTDSGVSGSPEREER